jgi:hypothetical protein
MEINKAKKRDMLEVFNIITSKGTKIGGAYEYLDIRASQDFDGYTCWLSYKDLTVSMLFHGKYDFDYKDKDTLKSFFNKISTVISDK